MSDVYELAMCSCAYCQYLRDGPAAYNIRELANKLVAEANARGVVLTIEQRPLTPLAMGNYETVVEVRKARARS